MAHSLFNVFSRKSKKSGDPTSQELASSVLEIHGLPPSLIPLSHVSKFSISPDGTFVIKLTGDVYRDVQNYCIKYTRTIRGTLAFGKIDGLKGVYSKDNRKLLPIDDLHIEWEDGEVEMVKLTIFGMPCDDIPGEAFRTHDDIAPCGVPGELPIIQAT